MPNNTAARPQPTEAESAKHTPGPWGLNPHDREARVYGQIIEALPGYTRSRAGVVAECSCTSSDLPDEEQLANARLIAAAPDLLALARAVGSFHLLASGDSAIGSWARRLVALAEGGAR